MLAFAKALTLPEPVQVNANDPNGMQLIMFTKSPNEIARHSSPAERLVSRIPLIIAVPWIVAAIMALSGCQFGGQRQVTISEARTAGLMNQPSPQSAAQVAQSAAQAPQSAAARGVPSNHSLVAPVDYQQSAVQPAAIPPATVQPVGSSASQAGDLPLASAQSYNTQQVGDLPAVMPQGHIVHAQTVGFRHRRLLNQAPLGYCPSCPDDSAGVVSGPCVQFTQAGALTVDPQEYLCNGGDLPASVRMMKNGDIGGLNPQDAAASYVTVNGDVDVQASNRVCVYSPRFGAVRQISGAIAGEHAVGPNNTIQPVGPNGFGSMQPSLAVQEQHGPITADVAKRIDGLQDRNRVVPVESLLTAFQIEDALETLAVLRVRGPRGLERTQIAVLQRGAVAAETWFKRDYVEAAVRDQRASEIVRDQSVSAVVLYEYPDDGRLEIVKVADRQEALQGEVVNFAIHVRNVGESALQHVEIADSLVTRLAYVEGSQSATADAQFVIVDNEASSSRISWTLTEPLKVGEQVTIQFQAKVR